MEKCPCFSGKSYQECCQIYHKGEIPKNPTDLMRSRFSAYALNLPDYIIETTHPANPHYSDNKLIWKRSLKAFSENAKFQNLEILDAKGNETGGTVTFIATLSQKGKTTSFTERSYFEKIEGKWLYLSGKISEGEDRSLVEAAPFQVLPLAYYPNPILRQRAKEIQAITPQIITLVENMIATMHATDGMGLAAPQVNHCLRLFVIKQPIETGTQKLKWGEIKVFINPEITYRSQSTWEENEGCLSIPQIRDKVKRPEEIIIEYTNLDGKRIKETVFSWEAKVICHEYDHIEGILFIDHLAEKDKWAAHLKSLEKRLK